MTAHLARRLAWCAAVVWAAVSITFAVDALLPGDPARMFAGPEARPADVARIRQQLGLDRPPLVRYGLFMRRLVHLGPRAADPTPPSGADHGTCAVVLSIGPTALHVDLGKSFQLHQPVARAIAERLPRTLALAVAGVLVQILAGAGAGALAGLARGSWLDRVLVGASLIGISAPTFVVALLLQYVLAYRLRLLPLDGFGSTLGEHARCIVLPAITLGVSGAAYYTRIMRDEMSVLVRQDWIRTARAKGAGAARVAVRHAMRNALVPVTAAAGLDFGALMGGAIVTETVFRWPGLGDLSVKATLNRDGPLLVGCVIVASVVVVCTNVVVDLVCAGLDPRTR